MTYLTGIVYRFTKLACCTGHTVTLTLDFQGKIFKWLYLRNRVSDWQEMKVMSIEAMLDPLYDLDFDLPMTLTLDFQGLIFQLYLRKGSAWHEMKGIWIDTMLDPQFDLDLWSQPWLWPWVFKVKSQNSCISEMDGSCFIWNICPGVQEINKSCKWQQEKE